VCVRERDPYVKCYLFLPLRISASDLVAKES